MAACVNQISDQLPWLLLILVAILSSVSHTATAVRSFSIIEATVDDLQLAFKQNKLCSRQLVEFYINRINGLNPVLHGVIEVNPDALYLADKADQERKVKAPISFSKLHGIPVLLKDNIATKDKTNTTAGSFALLGSVVPRDAGVAAKLRKSGAIILGKASMTEWAAYRGNSPNGWSARGGQGVVSIGVKFMNLVLYGINLLLCSCRVMIYLL